jgi:hypothetical protein
MERLRAALTNPHPGAHFAIPKVGPRSLARALGIQKDFSGCYVLIERGAPKYVGISRGVITRLRQHLLGKTHFDASLAYAIAQRRCPTRGRRSETMADARFREAFQDAQAYLVGLDIAYVDIENPLELYLFEAYAAIAFATFEWNTFRTH